MAYENYTLIKKSAFFQFRKDKLVVDIHLEGRIIASNRLEDVEENGDDDENWRAHCFGMDKETVEGGRSRRFELRVKTVLHSYAIQSNGKEHTNVHSKLYSLKQFLDDRKRKIVLHGSCCRYTP